jgi:hypothetical protein
MNHEPNLTPGDIVIGLEDSPPNGIYRGMRYVYEGLSSICDGLIVLQPEDTQAWAEKNFSPASYGAVAPLHVFQSLVRKPDDFRKGDFVVATQTDPGNRITEGQVFQIVNVAHLASWTLYENRLFLSLKAVVPTEDPKDRYINIFAFRVTWATREEVWEAENQAERVRVASQAEAARIEPVVVEEKSVAPTRSRAPVPVEHLQGRHKEVLRLLQRVEGVTPLLALRALGMSGGGLTKAISVLRSCGYRIIRDMHKDPLTGTRYATYTLDKAA